MKLSIITCTYNSEKTISDTICSVSNQTYSDIEYILVDGLSEDRTVDIIKAYEPGFEGRMKWVSEPDIGIYNAINKGIQLATGDIIGILNSDDFLAHNTIGEDIVGAFQENDLDAVYGDICYVSPTDLQKVVRHYSSDIFRPALMRLGFMPAHPSFYMKRSCYEEYGLYNNSYQICADFELLLRYIMIHKIRTHYLPKVFVTMRTGGVSTNGITSHKTIMREHLRACKENGIYTNPLILSLRYLYKLTEYINTQKKY